MATATDLALVTCTVDLHFTPTNADVAVPLLLSGVSRTEAKTGCRGCTVSRDANEPTYIHYSETWNDEAAFQRHLQSQEFQRVLAAMDMCCKEPQVVIGNLSGHTGISYLQKLREQPERGISSEHIFQ